MENNITSIDYPIDYPIYMDGDCPGVSYIVYYQIYYVIMFCLSLLFPITLLCSFVTLIGFISIFKCNIPAKKYYILLAFINFLCVIFKNWRRPFLIIFKSIEFLLSIYFPLNTYNWYHEHVSQYFISLDPTYLSIYSCIIINIIELSGQTITLYIQAVFGLHRMFIMIFPFKTYEIDYIFNNYILIPVIIIIICLWIPVFLFDNPIYGNYCWDSQFCCSPFWKAYSIQVDSTIKVILPTVIILITSLIIVTIILKAKKSRSLNKINKNKINAQSNSKNRGVITLLSLSLLFIIVNYPLIFKYILNAISSTNCIMIFLNIIGSLLFYIFDSGMDEICRLGNCLVFYFTIKQFRDALHKLMRFKIHVYLLKNLNKIMHINFLD